MATVSSPPIVWYAEHTDTFAGEANYGWLRTCRVALDSDASDRMVVRAIKAELGLTGVPCRTISDSDTLTLDVVGSCQIVFISREY